MSLLSDCQYFAAHLAYNYWDWDEFQYNISTLMVISSLDRPYCVEDLGSWIRTAALYNSLICCLVCFVVKLTFHFTEMRLHITTNLLVHCLKQVWSLIHSKLCRPCGVDVEPLQARFYFVAIIIAQSGFLYLLFLRWLCRNSFPI